jgi:hypothetical protein
MGTISLLRYGRSTRRLTSPSLLGFSHSQKKIRPNSFALSLLRSNIPAYLHQPPSLTAPILRLLSRLCLPIYLTFLPHLLCVSLQSSWPYRRGGSIMNGLTNPSPLSTQSALASLRYGWTWPCRQFSSLLAGCSLYFLSLDQRRKVYRFFSHWPGVH